RGRRRRGAQPARAGARADVGHRCRAAAAAWRDGRRPCGPRIGSWRAADGLEDSRLRPLAIMYQDYYNLRERPFDLTPNPRYLFFTPQHREALSNLQYGIAGRRGITLLVGEAGTGKTTLVRAALNSDLLRGARCLYLSNPTLTRQEFIEFLAAGFELSPNAASSKTTLLT